MAETKSKTTRAKAAPKKQTTQRARPETSQTAHDVGPFAGAPNRSDDPQSAPQTGQDAPTTRERDDDGGQELHEGVYGRPLLGSGSAGPAVFDLCERLEQLGYETSVSRGENALGVVDDTVLGAVNRFRSDQDVSEDVPGHIDARTVIGPETWSAILHATS